MPGMSFVLHAPFSDHSLLIFTKKIPLAYIYQHTVLRSHELTSLLVFAGPEAQFEKHCHKSRTIESHIQTSLHKPSVQGLLQCSPAEHQNADETILRQIQALYVKIAPRSSCFGQQILPPKPFMTQANRLMSSTPQSFGQWQEKLLFSTLHQPFMPTDDLHVNAYQPSIGKGNILTFAVSSFQHQVNKVNCFKMFQ